MTAPNNQATTVETQTATVYQSEDGVVKCSIKNGSHLTLEHAVENLDAVTTFYKGKRLLVLTDVSGTLSTTKEHRDYFITDKVKQVYKATAVLVSSPLTKTLMNLFLKMNKPPVEAKMFTNEEDARIWLLELD